MNREKQNIVAKPLVKAAFFDVDGVLKKYSSQGLPQRFENEAIEGLSILNENGIIVGYASGKCSGYLSECASLSGTLYDNSIIIGENGGVISLNGSKIIYDKHMEDLYNLRKFLERYKNDENIYELPIKSERSMRRSRKLCKIIEENKESMITLLFDPEEKEFVKEFMQEALTYFPYLQFSIGSCYVDINQRGCDKGYGIIKACELLGMKTYEVAAVGDGINDIPMLKIVGYPACPANSSDEVIKVVIENKGYVAKYPVGKGVKEICLEYLLKY